MSNWEQRLTQWGALVLTALALILTGLNLAVLLHLERDRFQNPLAVPVGVTWQKEHVRGGRDTVPVQYTDAITLKNLTGQPLEGVELVVSNWASAVEVKNPIGSLAPGETRISFITLPKGIPVRFEIDPKDVVIVRASGYAEKRIPAKELGKDKPLRDVEKEEDKENNADKDFWPKFWKWQDGLHERGIKPTEEMFNQLVCSPKTGPCAMRVSDPL